MCFDKGSLVNIRKNTQTTYDNKWLDIGKFPCLPRGPQKESLAGTRIGIHSGSRGVAGNSQWNPRKK